MNKNYAKNSYYQGLVQNLYGGSKGAFFAFMQFFCQYLKVEQQFEGLFKKLYQSELKNCKILGRILLRYGADARLCNCSNKCLTTFGINYGQEITQMLLADIELARLAVLEVGSAINIIEDKNIKADLHIVLDNKKASLKLLKEALFRKNTIN